MTRRHTVNDKTPADVMDESPYPSDMEDSSDYAIGRRLASARNAKALTQNALAKMINVDQSTLGHWERGRGKPGYQDLRKLQKILNVSVDWLIYGREDPPQIPPEEREQRLREIVERSKIDWPGITVPLEPGERDLPVRNQKIKEYDLKGGMGDGEVLALEHPTAAWDVPYGHFGRGELVIMDTKGDSMQPTLLSGDRLVINLNDRDPSQGGLFAINDGWGVKVKRVETVARSQPRMLRILSENSLYPADEIPLEENTILGRVVGYIRRL